MARASKEAEEETGTTLASNRDHRDQLKKESGPKRRACIREPVRKPFHPRDAWDAMLVVYGIGNTFDARRTSKMSLGDAVLTLVQLVLHTINADIHAGLFRVTPTRHHKISHNDIQKRNRSRARLLALEREICRRGKKATEPPPKDLVMSVNQGDTPRKQDRSTSGVGEAPSTPEGSAEHKDADGTKKPPPRTTKRRKGKGKGRGKKKNKKKKAKRRRHKGCGTKEHAASHAEASLDIDSAWPGLLEHAKTRRRTPCEILYSTIQMHSRPCFGPKRIMVVSIPTVAAVLDAIRGFVSHRPDPTTINIKKAIALESERLLVGSRRFMDCCVYSPEDALRDGDMLEAALLSRRATERMSVCIVTTRASHVTSNSRGRPVTFGPQPEKPCVRLTSLIQLQPTAIMNTDGTVSLPSGRNALNVVIASGRLLTCACEMCGRFCYEDTKRPPKPDACPTCNMAFACSSLCASKIQLAHAMNGCVLARAFNDVDMSFLWPTQ